MGIQVRPLDIAVFALYIVVVIGIGVVASLRTTGTKRDYFLAGDKLPWWMVGGSIVAANISSHHFVGVIGTAYTWGFAAITIEWGAILIGFNALLWIFLPFYLRNGFYTMPEFLEKRFGSTARITFAALILITYIFVEIAAVLYLGSVALESLFHWKMELCIVLLAVFTGVYTITGGLRAVVWTEMLQLVVLLSGGIALSVMTIKAVGGPSAIMASSKDWHLLPGPTHPVFPWTQFLGGSLCISIFYCAANQFIVQRALAAKNEWHARMGVVFTDYLKFLTPLIIIIPGLAAPTLFPNLAKPDSAFPNLVGKLLPTGLIGLVMAGLIAAIMSHISGAINSCTTITTVDFYLHVKKNATDKQAVVFGKLVGVIIVILGIAWGCVLVKHSDRPVFVYLLNAYGYITPGIATMFLLGILWKRATQAGVLTAGILTIPLSAVMEKLPNLLVSLNVLQPGRLVDALNSFMNRTGIVFWVCMLVAAIVSLCTTPKPSEQLHGLIWNKESLTLPKEQRDQMRGLRNPAIWWAIVTAAVLYFYVRYH